MSIRTNVENPFMDALWHVVRRKPPAFCRGIYHSSELSEEDFERLQDWCAHVVHTRVHWATNLSCIDAADLIVNEAVDNANIVPRKERAKVWVVT